MSVRQPDDVDLVVAQLGPGDLFGEYSLLTGHPTSATVRALDRAVVHRIARPDLQATLTARPELAVELSVLLAHRRDDRRSAGEEYLFGPGRSADAGLLDRVVGRLRDVLLARAVPTGTGTAGRRGI